MEDKKALVVFHGKSIRRRWPDDDWCHSVMDDFGINVSYDPMNNWKDIKNGLMKETGKETVTNCDQLKMPTEDLKF